MSANTNQNLYRSGEYSKYNPTWHTEDSGWKVKKIIAVIPESILRNLANSITIVDIGCGAGQILKQVCQHFQKHNVLTNAHGFDFSGAAIEMAQKNFPQATFHCQEFQKHYFREAKINVDFTLLIDILEHLQNPQDVLSDIAEISKYAICHLPLEDNLEVKLRRLKSRFKKTVGHLHYYNRKTAIELLQKNGFTIERMLFTCLDYDADYRMTSMPRRLIAQPLRKIFFKNYPHFTTAVLGNCSIMGFLRSRKFKANI